MKSVSLYIHIPFCLSKCSYCDFFSIPKNKTSCIVSDEYINALCNEMDFRFTEYGECQIKTVYIGGGTPSLLAPKQIKKICSTIKKYNLSEDLEFTFELNPDDVTQEILDVLLENGITRLSIGVQSFSDNVLKSVHRRADSDCIKRSLELIKRFWLKNVSADLICGLPYETKESMQSALIQLINFDIPHISFYSLCVEPQTVLGQKINSNQIPYSQDFADELWITGRDFLLSKGYIQYEISNFARPGFECIHNMTYWTHQDYIGIGAGAYGTVYFVDDDDKKGTGLRISNTKDIEQYCNFWNKYDPKEKKNIPQDTESLDRKTCIFEYFMMGLRTNRGILPSEYKELFGETIASSVLQKFKNWQQKGLCYYSPERIYLSGQGMLFLNPLLEELI